MMRKSLRTSLWIFGVIFLLLSVPSIAVAGGAQEESPKEEKEASEKEGEEAFPTKPIEMIVPYGAGGSTDTTARIIAKEMGEYLPNEENVVIVNQPGGSGTVGLTKLYNADSDGYTIGMTPSGALSVQPLYGKTEYNYDSFQPVMRVSASPILLTVKSDAQWETPEELVEYCKNNPGEFTYGSSGKGNPGNIAMELFNKELGVDTRQVAFEGQSKVFADLLGGHIDGATGSAQQGKSYVKEGEIRVLLNLGSTQAGYYKDVPTLQDLGADASTDVYFGIIAPPGIPENRLEILHNAFKKALKDPEVQKKYENAGIDVNYGSPEEFGEMIVNTSENAEVVLKDLDLIE